MANHEPRFFIDHGMIHDRVTGRHVTTEPDENTWAGQTITATCELLNQLSGSVPDREAFWLVERRVSPPQYVTDDGHDLTTDAFRAKRWTTERGAHDFWRLMTAPWRDECQAVEHLFINKP